MYAKPKRKNEDELIGQKLKDLSMKYLNWAGPPMRICADVWLATPSGSYLEPQAGLSSLQEPKVKFTCANQTQKDQAF